MPREDERYRNLSPRHPQYCTCVECVENRKSGGDGSVSGKVGGLVGKIAGKAAKAGKIGKGKKRGKTGGSGKARGRTQAISEPVRKHKADCDCATCTLLKSI
ncbi:MAG: hypothetical protein OXL37_00880 [Chloroflexota bacterium]|nr:hypothetical protein [Chloroflexota bacterium]MDE2961154.1 hypothetical protein [Chloroflexota bacterium]